MKNLDGRNVVVTGGSYGIGLEICRSFACRGANVFIIARNPERLSTAVEEIGRVAPPGRRVSGYPCDVSDRAAITRCIEEIARAQQGIDVLVNNAGTVVAGYFEDLSMQDFEAQVKTNFLGTVYATRAALPHLLSREESALVITSSLAGIKGVFGYSAYSPGKFALTGFAEVLRAELKSKGVQVTLLLPPDTDTPGYRRELKTQPPETGAVGGKAGLMQPQQVAERFIRSFIKGKFMVICGMSGRLLYRVNGITPGLTDRYMDYLVAREQRHREKHPPA